MCRRAQGAENERDGPAEKLGGGTREAPSRGTRGPKKPQRGGDRQQGATPKKTPGREEGAGEGREPGQEGGPTKTWGRTRKRRRAPQKERDPKEGERMNGGGLGRFSRGKAEPGRTFKCGAERGQRGVF